MSDHENDVDESMPVPTPATPARDPDQITEDDERADEYEETYMKMWNNVTNPKHVSCKTAFDILAWCYGPASQLRSVYRTGSATVCTQPRKDLELCIKVKAQALKDPEGAMVSLTHEQA